MSETMTAKQYDASYFQSQLNAEKERSSGGGARNEYFKLSAHQADFRILPGDPLFAPMRKHGYKNGEGRFVSSLDYGFLLGNNEIAEAAVAKGLITGDDLAAGAEFGDPFTTVARTAKELGVDDKAVSPLWSRGRYLWNVIDRADATPKVKLFESSKTFFDQIFALFEKANDIFDPEKGRDIGVKGNGQEGIRRRYDPPIADFNVSPIGHDGWEEELIDLNEVVVRAARPWGEVARAMFSKHGDLAAQVGITPDAWGL